MQNPLASKSKTNMKIHTLLLYEWFVFSIYDVLMWNMYILHFN
jgi:hypothetical protein